MSENLKVNAKTQILEFKRKHNKLVDSSLVKFDVSNITALTKEQLDSLQVGDVVQKITGNSKHCYIVSYKGTGAGTGICLTYCDASCIETVSYDRSGDNWVYNSTDFSKLERFEVIEWDGERNFTVEEFEKLFNLKACVMLDEESEFTYFYVTKIYVDSDSVINIMLISSVAYDDGLENGTYNVLNITKNLDQTYFDLFYYGYDSLKGTKLYLHTVQFSDVNDYLGGFSFISTSQTPLSRTTDVSLSLCHDFISCSVEENDMWTRQPVNIVIYQGILKVQIVSDEPYEYDNELTELVDSVRQL